MSSLSCNLSALDPEQRKRHDLLARELFRKHLEVKELADGYGFRFSSNGSLFTALSEWITSSNSAVPSLDSAWNYRAIKDLSGLRQPEKRASRISFEQSWD